MHTDIVASMIIYTVATIAFYLLGAGVLHGMNMVPKEKEMISTLSNIYTQTLGGWSRWIFYAGAIVTLYGTIFAATAANSRVFSDMCRLMGLFRADDGAARVRYRNGFVVALTVIPVVLIFIFTDPVHMVRIGGISQAMMLPVIGIGAVYLRHRHLPKDIAPSGWVTVGLWVATALIVWLMGYSVIEAIRKML
jgi:amino acid transporter